MIISISGLKNSGKDLVGKIIQYLAIKNRQYSFEKFVEYTSKHNVWGEDGHYPYMSDWKIKKFADKLKDIVCILLDCSRKDLENEEFKDKELDEKWEVFNCLVLVDDDLSNRHEFLATSEVIGKMGIKDIVKSFSKKSPSFQNLDGEYQYYSIEYLG